MSTADNADPSAHRTQLLSALQKLEPHNVKFDEFGRIIIDHPDLSGPTDLFKALGMGASLASNYGCCENGASCGKAMLEAAVPSQPTANGPGAGGAK